MTHYSFIMVGVACFVVLFAGLYYFLEQQSQELQITIPPNTVGIALSTNPYNASYVIEGETFSLTDGVSEIEAAPGSATKVSTKVFGEPVLGDLDADGDDDAGLILFQNAGGTGTFFYLAAAINTDGIYMGTNTILLGDRIAPQTLEIHGNVMIANYADRTPDEPMSAEPSVGVSKYVVLKNGTLEEIVTSDKSNLVAITAPLPGSSITSPLTVIGRARGFWYFEASFPLVLVDWDGKIIAEGHATAEDEWMTKEFVPFRGILEFKKPANVGAFSKRGALILRKDNPSGLPEHDNALEIPIQFE